MRWLTHAFSGALAKRRFPPASLDAIQRAIAESEHRHAGQVVFAVEGSLPFSRMRGGLSARQRADELFAHLRVWNTEHNSGVLVYVLLADRAIEIVADRGISARVDEAEWRAVCALMQQQFAKGHYEAGALAGVAAITQILERCMPASGGARVDELPDRPILL